MKRLFKVKVETEIMVMAESSKEAIQTALKNASGEIGIYGKGDATPINSIMEIPEDWKGTIPYCPEGSQQETRKCYEVVSDFQKNSEKGLDDKDVQEIIRIKQQSKLPEEVKPELRPEPKPKELKWKETKSGRPQPFLRFV